MVAEITGISPTSVLPVPTDTSLSQQIFDELAEIASRHQGEHVALETDDLVFRHAIQALRQPTTPWEIATAIPQAVRGKDVTDTVILHKLMGTNGSFDRLRAAGALTPQELAQVKDLRRFLSEDHTYQGMLQVNSPTLQRAIDLGIHVAETLPGNYQPAERATILTGGLKYIAEGYGFLGTRQRAKPLFGGKWESLGVSTLNMLLNQHRAITAFPQETAGFVSVYQQAWQSQQTRQQETAIVWPPIPPRTPTSSAGSVRRR